MQSLISGSVTPSPSPAWSCPCWGRARSAYRPSSPGPESRSPRARAPRPLRSLHRRCVPRRGPDRLDDLGQCFEGVAADERVAIREGGHHAPGTDCEVIGADARVDPHDPVGEAGQALHLATDEQRVASLPAVGHDHDHSAARHSAASVAVVELAQRMADPGSARPVGCGRGGPLDRASGIARGKRAGDARQPRCEDERLGVRAVPAAHVRN